MDNQMMPVTTTKRIWNLVRVIFLTARKGISGKRKLLFDLNLLLKKGKIAGKTVVGNLKHYQRHHYHPSSATARTFYTNDGEYEFSCSDTPAHYAMFNFINHHLPGNIHVGGNKHTKGDTNSNMAAECPDFFVDEAVNRVLDALAIRDGDQLGDACSLSSSATLLVPKMMDSPFPLQSNENNRHVDEAAEDFINRFYSHLRQQRLSPGPHGAD